MPTVTPPSAYPAFSSHAGAVQPAPSPLQARLLQLVCLWLAVWALLVVAFSRDIAPAAWAALLALPLVALVYFLQSRGHLRWAAGVLVAGAMALVSALAWVQALHQTSTILLLAVMVVFAAWMLGLLAGAVAAVAAVLLGVALTLRGDVAWQQVLIAGYVLASLLAMIAWMLRSKTQQVDGLHSALQVLGAEKQQLHVLFQAVEQNPQSILIVDAQGGVVYANAAFVQHTGYARDEVVGQPARQVSLTGLGAAEYAHMRTLVEAGKPWQGVVHNTLKNGQVAVDAVRITPVADGRGVLSHLVEVRQDISEQLEAQNRLRHLQEHDSLTQLLNTQGLLRAIDRMAAAIAVHHNPYTWHMLVLLEIDRFQMLVSARGHPWVHAMLQALVQQLQALAPHGAQLARTAESQFALLIARVGDTRHDARMEGHALSRAIHQGLTCLQLQTPAGALEPVQLTCSMGFTVFPFVEDGLQKDSSSHVLRRATLALSQARHQGGNQVSAYSEVLDAAVRRRMDMEAALATALSTDQLRVFLQPQVDMDGQVQGLEALVRWQHPLQGMIPPGEFIAVAEDSGMVVQLGEWMLQQVCQLLQDPRVQQAGYSLSVNVSAVQFRHEHFVARVQALVQSLGGQAQRLVLEVTESFLLADVEQAIRTMHSLRALGVQLALDDFGTGYSSLAYLAQLPIQEIKLDQVFIRDLVPGSQASVLVEAVLMVAKSKGLRVVAEGVEQREQAQLLQALEPSVLCQGYWFAPPMLAQDWLAHPQLVNAM